MTVPRVTAVPLAGDRDLPLLVVGPSLGTSATALWSGVAERLADAFHIVAWDLPGHGHNRTATGAGFDMAGLAGGVLAAVEEVLAERGEPGASFAYAGDSVGGAVGLQLLLDARERVRSAVLCCTGARIGTADGWYERAELVRREGTSVMVEGSAQRWFVDGFLESHAAVGATLLASLEDAAAEGYAATCEALAGFDVRDRLGEIAAPVLAIAGRTDESAPLAGMQQLAADVRRGRLVVLDDVKHLAPAESPDTVARLVREHLDAPPTGESVRRAVLGDAHVDRAAAATTGFTRDFQDFITAYAWGGIWTRPGLDRRSRSMITLTALIAGGHLDELALHVRGARRNGLSDDEIKEVVLHSSIYCGVPAANSAFRVAQRVLAEMDAEDD